MLFKLESLLKLRRNQENEKLKRFAEVNAHLVKQREHLSFVSKMEQRNVQLLDNQVRANPDVNILWLYNNFFDGSCYQEECSKLIISEAEKKLETSIKDLTDAMRKRKTLELLKEKELEALKKKTIKQELHLLDESGSNLWTRTHI